MQRWNMYWSIEWYLLAIMTTNADLINSSSKRSSWGFCSQHKADSSALEQKSTIDSVSSLFSPLLLCIENFASEIESTRASNQKNKDNCTIAVPWKDQPHCVHTKKHFLHIVSQKPNEVEGAENLFLRSKQMWTIFFLSSACSIYHTW